MFEDSCATRSDGTLIGFIISSATPLRSSISYADVNHQHNQVCCSVFVVVFIVIIIVIIVIVVIVICSSNQSQQNQKQIGLPTIFVNDCIKIELNTTDPSLAHNFVSLKSLDVHDFGGTR
uniref:Uncharacterized protein n=1 Tax=Glossina austeni TaxID=7395 RepID=A0A1A9VRQ3_GLOAU